MQRIDTPVMLLFFNRPEVFRRTFEWVKKVQPRQLFLVQDGARPGRGDEEKIQKCREIAEDIDWDCDVKKNYAEHNMSCDYREFTGIDWCFQYVDRLIIMEDDCEPVESFYSFCGELLQKYESDNRVHIISGFNRAGVYKDTPYDYTFSAADAGWGWATWKRTWDSVLQLSGFPLLQDTDSFQYYKNIMGDNYPRHYSNIFERMQTTQKNDISCGYVTSWETYVGAALCMNNVLSIVPSRNMIRYHGISADATHCDSDARILPHKIREMLTQPAYDLTDEIKHPPFIVRDQNFEKQDFNAFQSKHPFLETIELIFLRIRYGRWDLLLRAIKRRIMR